MILLIIALVVFYQGAQKRGLMPWVWVVIALGSHFTTPLLAGVIIGLTNPAMANDEEALLIWGYVTSLGGLVIAWMIMEQAGKRRQRKTIPDDERLLDDRINDL